MTKKRKASQKSRESFVIKKAIVVANRNLYSPGTFFQKLEQLACMGNTAMLRSPPKKCIVQREQDKVSHSELFKDKVAWGHRYKEYLTHCQRRSSTTNTRPPLMKFIDYRVSTLNL